MGGDMELKPCPFCGGEAGLKEYKPNVSGVAICKECGARSPICKNDHTGGWKPKAIEAWNTRTPEQAIAATLGSGNLTADDIRSIIERHSDASGGNGRDFHNGAYEAIADDLNATLGGEINGDTSDGYHTFNELYHHRAVLFSVVVAANSNRAWKSKLHHDGTMYEGMFIVGIDTPEGQATYHYDVEPYWDMFWCKELERAPEWDGHTSDDAIERIGLLRDVVLKGPRGRR